MKIILFGASGMIGQGVLRECLGDPRVECVLAIVRQPLGRSHPKLRELVHRDFQDYASITGELSGYDACLFCLGVSSAGMKEAEYQKVTYGLTLAAAETLARLDPAMTFLYVSGQSTDETELGRLMWARVKGATENALLRLPFRAVYLFRPGFIQPLHGIRSRTRLYRIVYALARPLMPLLKRLAPESITTTEQLGRAMLRVALEGYERPRLEMRDINRL